MQDHFQGQIRFQRTQENLQESSSPFLQESLLKNIIIKISNFSKLTFNPIYTNANAINIIFNIKRDASMESISQTYIDYHTTTAFFRVLTLRFFHFRNVCKE